MFRYFITSFLLHIFAVTLLFAVNYIKNNSFMDVEAMIFPARSAYLKNFIDIIDEDAEPVYRKLTKKTNALQTQNSLGMPDMPGAVDIGFMDDISPPRLVGSFRRDYPKKAREQNIEAVVNTELYIGTDGIVKFVNILGVKLSKELPAEIKKKFENEFVKNTVRSLTGAQFTPCFIKGKKVPIKMEMPVQYKLEN